MGFPFLQKNDRFLRCEKSKGRQGGIWGGETPASNVNRTPTSCLAASTLIFFFSPNLLTRGLRSALFSTTRKDSSSRPRPNWPGPRRGGRLAAATFSINLAPAGGWLSERRRGRWSHRLTGLGIG